MSEPNRRDIALDRFLSAQDIDRATRALAKLCHHDVSRLALTGGIAIELQLSARKALAKVRPFNDIDLTAERFDDIPKSLGTDFRFNHVHPDDPPGKTLMQLVDPESRVRIDIFRAYGEEIGRAQTIELCGLTRMLSLEDLVARSARICLDLTIPSPVPAKHACDFIRLLPFADREKIDAVWKDHRKSSHARRFSEVVEILEGVIPSHPELQIDPQYSRHQDRKCDRCKGIEAFPLASGEQIKALLGYC